MFSPNIFRTYDIRGKYPSEVNEKVAESLGKVAKRVLNCTKLCVASDTRLSSPVLLKTLVKSLIESGVEVHNLEQVPNPIAYHYCWREKMYGIYITASHNPGQYNGFKFIKHDGTSMLEEYYKIAELMKKGRIPSFKEKGKEVKIDGLEEYLKTVSKVVGDISDIRIVIETFGGVVNKVLDKIIKEFGLKAKILHHEIRGDFYGLRPEPTKENLKLLHEEVLKFNADLGVAFDGDSDRSVFVDDKGNILDGSSAGILLVELLVKSGDKVVITPDTSSLLEEYIRKKGGEPILSRIGHIFIEKAVLEKKAVLGIEQSSHFYHGYIYPFSDGLLSMLKMCELAKQVKLSEILSKIPLKPIIKFYVNVETDEIKWKIMEKVRKMFPDSIKFPDGIKFYLENGWVLIRSSQTMPEINICIEAVDENTLEKLRKKYTNLVLKLKEEIKRGN